MTTMSSRAPPATAAKRGGEGAAAATDQLWAKAAELERDFAGYKRRFSERRAQAAAEVVAGEEERRDGGDAAAAGGRGRRYEEYVRKRDERLRHEWRARMERKEAEMQALWARLDRSGSSRARLAGDGELAVAGQAAREDHGDLRQKPVKLAEVRVKLPPAPVTPRCSPATTKLSRPRTSVPSSPATTSPSPRLSTPDPRRRPLHLPAEPPATPRKENRMPLPSSTATATASPGPPGTPRPRTMLSRSRSLFKDRGCSSMAVRESPTPRPPRVQPPRSSCDSASNLREPVALPMHADAIAVTLMKSSSCSSQKAGVADLKKVSVVSPEPFHPRRSGNNVIELSSLPPLVIPRDEHESRSDTAPAGDGNADDNINHEHVEQSSDKFESVEITGDSDTEPSYVYIKKDSGEQSPRPCPAPAGLGTCPGDEPRSSDNKNSDNVDDTVESTGSNDVSGETPVTDTEEASRRASSESLYSNVQSSFSPRSELDMSATDSPLPSATQQSPESMASPRPRKKPEVEDTEKSIPIPTTPRSSVTVQSPMDAVTGLKRLLSFGKKNSKGSEAAAYIVERTPCFMSPASPAGDSCRSGDWPAGESIKARLDSDDVASADDLDKSYVISPHVRSLQSFVPSELKGPVLHAKSPRVHRSFFSFSSFKSRAN